MPAWRCRVADPASDLLTAARKGQTDRVRSLLAKKAPIEAKDKEGRTPLMLAAEHAHADTVRLLLDKGAAVGARDRQGWTAYGLALFSSPGGREAVLAQLPRPQSLRVTIEAQLAPDNLYSSCFMSPPQLAKLMTEIRLEAVVLSAVREVAARPGLPQAVVPVELVPADGDATAILRVRPQASCVQQQSSDNLSLAIDVRVTLNSRPAPILEKTFGGGLKGLHARRATSPAQYGALFSDWARNHAVPIYWAIVAALLKAGT